MLRISKDSDYAARTVLHLGQPQIGIEPRLAREECIRILLACAGCGNVRDEAPVALGARQTRRGVFSYQNKVQQIGKVRLEYQGAI